MYFMGIDAGTQGVRSAVADEHGHILAACSTPFARLNESTVPGHAEQDPAVWAAALERSVGHCTAELKNRGLDPAAIRAIAIDGTSGTVVPVDSCGTPLCHALMYNDSRAAAEAAEIHAAAADHEQKMGLRFNSSFALPRVLWLLRHRPDCMERASRIVHQADWLVGQLCGEYGVSDYSNALKTGYDLVDEQWPALLQTLHIDTGLLPHILAPGTPIAPLRPEAAQRLGLSTDTVVVAGATDGYASALAAGAVRPGDWASIIGTTLVLKGVSPQIVRDPTGSSYCHKLPAGTWMLGGASNVGGRCLNARFDPSDFAALNAHVDTLSPTGVLTYPLTMKGERYPFVDPEAEAFLLGDASDPRVLYTALMEGVGYTERLAYENYRSAGLTVGDTIYTSGGACRSDPWLRLRASILGRCLKVPAVVDATMGMILLAAAETFGGLEQAAAGLIRFEKTVEPDSAKIPLYDELFSRFTEACRTRFSMDS